MRCIFFDVLNMKFDPLFGLRSSRSSLPLQTPCHSLLSKLLSNPEMRILDVFCPLALVDNCFFEIRVVEDLLLFFLGG